MDELVIGYTYALKNIRRQGNCRLNMTLHFFTKETDSRFFVICHPERSEGSPALQAGILRPFGAQNDTKKNTILITLNHFTKK
jgi:hypothetical protein